MKLLLPTNYFVVLMMFTFIGKLTNAQGTWTAVATTAPDANMGVMILLSDGTVMCKTSTGGTDGYGTVWDRLTPDIHGSYVNGTWTTLAAMHSTRLFFSSQVLKDGRVYVAGGEYGTGGSLGETYDPLTNIWTNAPAPGKRISDANSEILPDGRVLQALVTGSLTGTDIYDPVANTYVTGPTAFGIHNESAWVKLPDNSLLYVNRLSTSSERYIPSTTGGIGTWVTDGTVPVSLYDSFGDETGPGFLLPDGRAFFIGATGHTAYYTPSGTSSPGTWAAGPDIPSAQGTPDAPGAMMVNGKILCSVSPVPTSGTHFPSPTAFYEFDYTTNSFTLINAPGGGTSLPIPCFITNFLDLPDGTVLYSVDQDGLSSYTYYVYSPGGTPLAAGKPTISNITQTGCNTYTLTGTLFNGISEGAAYGDDWQMASNYPLVRLTSVANVYYARTFNWNSTGVQTGALSTTTQFTVPASLPVGTYSLVVIANGISSDPISFSQTFPLLISSCGGTNVSCKGASTGSASVTASGGSTPYSYKWSNTATTSSISNVTAGTYIVTVTDFGGCTTSCSFISTQPAAALSATCGGVSVSCNGGNNGAASVTASGGTIAYSYKWNTGPTTSSISNLTPATYTVTVTDSKGCTTSCSFNLTQPSLLTASCGGVNVSCNGGNTGSASVTASGGTIAYSYKWTNNATASSISSLAVGTYTLTVTDSKGCTTSCSVSLTQPSALSVSCTGTNVSCYGGNNGSASVTANGGTTAYSYKWSNGPATSSISNLTAGTYTVTVTDSKGCTASCSFIPTQPALTASAGNNSPLCSGGTLNLLSSGGTSYSWSGPNSFASTKQNPSIINVTTANAGTYTVSVTNVSGCTASVSTSVSVNSLPVATAAGNSPVCSGSSLNLSSSGGTSYSWAGPNSFSSTIQNPLILNVTVAASGTYTVTVTNASGCQATASVSISVNNCTIAFQLKLFIEGYYIGNGLMKSVLHNENVDLNPNSTNMDTVLIELHDPVTTSAIVASFKGVLQTNGSLACTFPASVATHSYYIAVKHRCAVQTWSADPVLFGTTTSYDFTTPVTRAYGSNMTLADGVYLFYGADFNQDENIDLLDFPDIDNNIYHGYSGYYKTDLNGDGNVDLLDFPQLYNNIYFGISSAHP